MSDHIEITSNGTGFGTAIKVNGVALTSAVSLDLTVHASDVVRATIVLSVPRVDIDAQADVRLLLKPCVS